MPDYRYTPPRRYAIPTVSPAEDYSAATTFIPLDDDENTQQADSMEGPGWFARTTDVAKTFGGAAVEALGSVPAWFGAYIGENVIDRQLENADKTIGEDIDDPEIRDKIIKARKKAIREISGESDKDKDQSEAKQFLKDAKREGWNGVGDIDDSYSYKQWEKDTGRNEAIPTEGEKYTEKARDLLTHAKFNPFNLDVNKPIEKVSQSDKELESAKHWEDQMYNMANYFAYQKMNPDVKNPEHGLVTGMYNIADQFDRLADFLYDWRSDYTKMQEQQQNEFTETHEAGLDAEGLKNVGEIIKYGWNHPWATAILATRSLPSTLLMAVGAGKIGAAVNCGKAIAALATMGVPKKAAQVLVAGSLMGQTDGMLSAIQNITDVVAERRKKGEKFDPHNAFWMGFDTYVGTALWDTLTAGGVPVGKFTSRISGIGNTAKNLVGSTSDTAQRGIISRLLRGALGIGKGAIGEAAQEAPQSAWEQAIENIYTNENWQKGVLSAATVGGLAGFAMGAGFHGVNILGNRRNRAIAQLEQSDQHSVGDVINSSESQATGGTNQNPPPDEGETPPPSGNGPMQPPGGAEATTSAGNIPANNLPQTPVDQAVNTVQQAPQQNPQQQQEPQVVTPDNAKDEFAKVFGKMWADSNIAVTTDKQGNTKVSIGGKDYAVAGTPLSALRILSLANQINGGKNLDAAQVTDILDVLKYARDNNVSVAEALREKIANTKAGSKEDAFYTELLNRIEATPRPAAQQEAPQEMQGTPDEVPPITPVAQTEETKPVEKVEEKPKEKVEEKPKVVAEENKPSVTELNIPEDTEEVNPLETRIFKESERRKWKKFFKNDEEEAEFKKRKEAIDAGKIPPILSEKVQGKELAAKARKLVNALKKPTEEESEQTMQIQDTHIASSGENAADEVQEFVDRENGFQNVIAPGLNNVGRENSRKIGKVRDLLAQGEVELADKLYNEIQNSEAAAKKEPEGKATKKEEAQFSKVQELEDKIKNLDKELKPLRDKYPEVAKAERALNNARNTLTAERRRGTDNSIAKAAEAVSDREKKLDNLLNNKPDYKKLVNDLSTAKKKLAEEIEVYKIEASGFDKEVRTPDGLFVFSSDDPLYRKYEADNSAVDRQYKNDDVARAELRRGLREAFNKELLGNSSKLRSYLNSMLNRSGMAARQLKKEGADATRWFGNNELKDTPYDELGNTVSIYDTIKASEDAAELLHEVGAGNLDEKQFIRAVNDLTQLWNFDAFSTAAESAVNKQPNRSMRCWLIKKLQDYWNSPETGKILLDTASEFFEQEFNGDTNVGLKDLILKNNALTADARYNIARTNAIYLISLCKAKGLDLRYNNLFFTVTAKMPGEALGAFYPLNITNGEGSVIAKVARFYMPVPSEAYKAAGPHCILHEFMHSRNYTIQNGRGSMSAINSKLLSVFYDENDAVWKPEGRAAKALSAAYNKKDGYDYVKGLFAYPLWNLNEKASPYAKAVKEAQGRVKIEGQQFNALVDERIFYGKDRMQGELHAQIMGAYLAFPEISEQLEVLPGVKEYIAEQNQLIEKTNAAIAKELKDVKQRSESWVGYTDKKHPRTYYYANRQSPTGIYSDAGHSGTAVSNGVGAATGTKSQATSGEEPRTQQTNSRAESEISGDEQSVQNEQESVQSKVQQGAQLETNSGTSSPTNSREVSGQYQTATRRNSGLTQQAQQAATLASDEAPPPPPPPTQSGGEGGPPIPPMPPSGGDAITNWLENNFGDSRDPFARALGSKLISLWKDLNNRWDRLNMHFLAPAWKLEKMARESIPTIKKLYDTMAEHTKRIGELMNAAALINEAYHKIKDPVMRKRVSKYLYKATMTNEWGYIPDWMTEEQKKKAQKRMTPERVAAWNSLSKDAQKVIDSMYKHEHDLWVRRKKLLAKLKTDLTEPAIKEAQERVARLNKIISETEDTAENKAKLDKLKNELKAAESDLQDAKDLLGRLNEIQKVLDKQEVLPYAPLRRNGRFAVVYKSDEFAQLQKEVEEGNKAKGLSREEREVLKAKADQLEEMKADENHYEVRFFNTMYSANEYKRNGFANRKGTVYAFEREGASRVKGLSLSDRAEVGELVKEQLLNSKLSHVWFGSDESAIRLTNYVMEALNEIYERAASELVRDSSSMERKKVAGADEDMVNSFMQQARTDAVKIANLEYSAEIAKQMAKCRAEAKEATRKGDERAMTILKELEDRYHDTISRMSPEPTDVIIERARAFTTVLQLLLRPAFYIQNSTQPGMMTFPELAGVYGGAKAFGSLTRAYGTLARIAREYAKNSKTNTAMSSVRLADAVREANLPEDVKKLFEELDTSGLLDLGKETDFGTVEVTGSISKYSNMAMTRLSKLARSVEVMNRFVSAMAAYELSKEDNLKKGLSRTEAEENARDYARGVVARTQGDYSASSAPIIFNTRYGKLGLQFRKFQLFQYAWFSGMVHDAFAGASKEEKASARRQLAYAMMTHGLFGIKGLPGAALAMFLAGAVGGSDDGEDFETTLRKEIGDPEIADLLLEGLTSYLFRLNLTGMIGAGEMLALTPYAKKEITDEGGLEAAALAMMGPFASRMFRAGDAIVGGNMKQLARTLLPNGPVSVWDAFQDGYENPRTREKMLSEDDFQTIDRVWQWLGFQPKPIEEMYAMKNALARMDKYYSGIKSELTDMYNNARETKSAEDWKQFRDTLQQVNAKRREAKLQTWKMSDFVSQVKRKNTAQKNAVHGAKYTKTNKGYAKEIENAYWRQ